MELVLIRAEIFGENAAGQKHIHLLANNADGIHFWTDDKSIVRSIEPQRKKGKWIYGESEAGNDGYYCSKCGNFVPWKYDKYDIGFIKEFLFCNKCGADMREPEDIPMEYFESGGR